MKQDLENHGNLKASLKDRADLFDAENILKITKNIQLINCSILGKKHLNFFFFPAEILVKNFM